MGIDVDHVDPTTFPEDVEMRVREVTGAEPFPEADTDPRLTSAGRPGRRRDSPMNATPGTWSVGRFSTSSTSGPSPSPGPRAGISSPVSTTARAGSATSSRVSIGALVY